MSIGNTYELIQQRIPPSTHLDSLAVVKQVEEYRQYWKPDETNVALLAESHVYTDEEDYETKCRSSILYKIIPDYPLRFVRFVYCLGYGEDWLLQSTGTERKNTGTPQYWKIFSSCVAEDERDLGFHKILKKETPSIFERLRNKVAILQEMKERGIWLLDASIVGLYGSGAKHHNINEKIIETCWLHHIAGIIQESKPKHIIVIGSGVDAILHPKLNRLGIPFTVVHQPQARDDKERQLENYKKYQRICARF
jgi:hypothetical protein